MAEEVSQNVDFPKVLRAYTQNQPILNEWTNHSAFYAIYPRYYFTFANQWLRKWLAWFDGYVPGIHDGVSGIISTRLATTLCYRLGEQVFGGGLLYSNSAKTKDHKEALRFISGKWNDEADLDNQLLKAFILAAAGGTSYIKTNKGNDGELWVDTWRADQCWSDVDFKGNVNKAKFLISKYTKTVPTKDKEQSQNFYLVEERFIANRKDAKDYKKQYHDEIQSFKVAPNLHIGGSYVKYQVFKLQGVVNDFNQGVDLGRALNWEDLPKEIKESIIDAYGTIKLNIPQKLPFIDLGVDMFKWTSFISNLPQLPYGESVIAKIQAYLFEYDFVNSAMNTDVYLGRGRVMIPKSLQSPNRQGMQGTVQGGYNQGLDSFIFTKVDYASTEDKKPEAIQFDLRSQEWVTARNNLLESIATAIGISPSTIASYLNDNSNRTAREISSEESATALFIENRRKLFSTPINNLIKRILLYYGFTDCVVAKFSKSGQTNTTLVTENTISAYNAKLMSQYQAVKNLNPDMSEEELQGEIDRINAEQDKLREQNENFGFNDFKGDFGGINEETNRISKETEPELASDTDRRSTN